MSKKVTIVGAGNVGGTAAMRIYESGLARVAMIDIAATLASAKAEDLQDAQALLGVNNRIEVSSDFALAEGSDIVVVTAGMPRKQGMTREDLLNRNADIMENVCRGVAQFAQGAIVVIVSNPLDVMTFFARRRTGFPRQRLFGMGPSLDTSRFIHQIARTMRVSPLEVRALVIGSHGETMLPLGRLAMVREKKIIDTLGAVGVEDLVRRTRQRGAEIVSLYGSGSAYYAPSAAVFEIVSTILRGRRKEIPVSVCLEGEYGLTDVAIGVPARIGPEGVERVIEVPLEPAEREAFEASARAIQSSIASLLILP
ncbi:MAG: malate dehydrogenase [Deltaproteobacteria bacterium]